MSAAASDDDDDDIDDDDASLATVSVGAAAAMHKPITTTRRRRRRIFKPISIYLSLYDHSLCPVQLIYTYIHTEWIRRRLRGGIYGGPNLKKKLTEGPNMKTKQVDSTDKSEN